MDNSTKGFANKIVSELGEIKTLIHKALSPAKTKAGTANKEANQRFKWLRERRVEVAGLIVLIAYTAFTKQTLDATRETLKVSQQAYVTVGKRDGIVAEFAIPKDPKDGAGIIIYFQNGGHLPAKLNWGTLDDIAVVPPMPTFPPITSPHQFHPMTRTRNHKDGSYGESRGQTIAGDAIYIADVAELPQARVSELAKLNRILMINGAFEYCDALGTYTCREFRIYYQGIPYNSFRLVSDTECPVPIRTPPLVGADIEYLPACQTFAETEIARKYEDREFRRFLETEAAKKGAAHKP